MHVARTRRAIAIASPTELFASCKVQIKEKNEENERSCVRSNHDQLRAKIAHKHPRAWLKHMITLRRHAKLTYTVLSLQRTLIIIDNQWTMGHDEGFTFHAKRFVLFQIFFFFLFCFSTSCNYIWLLKAAADSRSIHQPNTV